MWQPFKCTSGFVVANKQKDIFKLSECFRVNNKFLGFLYIVSVVLGKLAMSIESLEKAPYFQYNTSLVELYIISNEPYQ